MPLSWRIPVLSRSTGSEVASKTGEAGLDTDRSRSSKWSMGVLNDKRTDEVPGSVLLLPSHQHNRPLGTEKEPVRIHPSSIDPLEEKKKTPNGLIILDPQPDESLNDPLNWPAWKRDTALLCLGFYCMVGGGMTPILAAGFNDVAETYRVSIPEVARTTGLYMMGLGIGAVVSSPTAILYGKRPVYLVGIILFCASAIWCAASPNYTSLLLARIVQGIAVSPCESLPSATIAEIFFLHERAYRVGVYTLLLLGGKNLVPLVSAVIIQGLDWRWVFWIVAMIVGLCFFLLFFFVPETFWDRAPQPKKRHLGAGGHSASSIFHLSSSSVDPRGQKERQQINTDANGRSLPRANVDEGNLRNGNNEDMMGTTSSPALDSAVRSKGEASNLPTNPESHPVAPVEMEGGSPTANNPSPNMPHPTSHNQTDVERLEANGDLHSLPTSPSVPAASSLRYTTYLKTQPPRSFRQTLRPFHGRLRTDSWLRVALRPFILFAYPAVLWSTMVYSLSVGWLIVLSESVAHIYQDPESYNFSALGTGLVYLSPFIGGILGTAVAGKVSDIIVRWMSRRNGGIYEPEFRLVMALPVMVTTCIGLMGFGWSAEERDQWMVPTFFFGVISFGCSLGSTTAITFCVDSYRRYAGEALVTLNFSKNVFHGLVFSLFFNAWLEHDGAKDVFLALGGIQLACLLTTVPMYIYGKRARMWTVRKRLMERL
ncbi:MAG: hypothetical protein M1817_001446 [Caeruleum heppii]|nr:MAG: hypothetical protein M1817_001446 [Caeruleum heppii]